MKKLLISAPILMVLFFAPSLSFSTFGDIVDFCNLNWYQPISITFGDGYLWILDAKAKEYEPGKYCLTFYKCEKNIGGKLHILDTFYIKWYLGSDLNGFCYVTEYINGEEKEFIWTAETNGNQLWQLDIYGQIDGDEIPAYRKIRLPDGYYPTCITLDELWSIYFVDGITRTLYKIDYNDYFDIPPYVPYDIPASKIEYVLKYPLPEDPSIPMGIECVYEFGEKRFYISLAGENDYIIKIKLPTGEEVAIKDLHIQPVTEHKSYMPTDLTVDDDGYVWFTDDDYNRLYKMATQ